MLLLHVHSRVHVRHLQPRRGVQPLGGGVDGVGRDALDGESQDRQQSATYDVHLDSGLPSRRQVQFGEKQQNQQ